MSEPILGEIRDFGFAIVPRGWKQCNGELLPISGYQSLYSLIGTTYGGDGHTTFALPDLRGRVPLGKGQVGSRDYRLGQKAGSETIALTESNLPPHSHELLATTNEADTDVPSGGVLANSRSNLYASPNIEPPLDATMRAESIADSGSNVPVENRQPLLVTNYCIAIEGVFPQRS